MIRLWDLYITFFKIGAILIGGGYVILPILKKEIIDNKNWITEEQLVDYYAISQSLPGLIAANISIFVGYKLKGKIGAIISTLGIITAPFICINVIAIVMAQIINSPAFKGILWGVSIGVIVLIIASIQELWKKAITDKFTLIIFLFFLIAILKFNIAPTPIIISSIIIGIFYKRIKRIEVKK